MQESSLVTNTDVDTQVIHDLMEGQIDSERLSGKEILAMLRFLTAHSVTTYSHVPHADTQLACLSVDADTIESFPVESPVSYDDIQDESTPLRGLGSPGPSVSDAVLSCDCHVSVRCDSHFRISPAHVRPSQADDECILCEGDCKRWYHIWYVSYKVTIARPSPVFAGVWGTWLPFSI